MRLKDKVAIVTGASSGIGSAVCQAYASEGAKVVVNYRGPAEEQDAFEVVNIIKQKGGTAVAVRCDVSKEEEINEMIKRVSELWDGVDILVNNAGIYPRKKWYEITVEEWDYVQAVNLRACFLTSKAVYPYMKKNGYGKIINVSSVTFWNGQKGFPHYVASKGGVIGYTRALAREVGEDGICVNAITPGAVLTEQEINDLPDAEERSKNDLKLIEAQSLKRRQVPRDMIGTYIFLASSDSDFMTGQALNVDGGWMMH